MFKLFDTAKMRSVVVPISNGGVAIIDAEDFEKVSAHHWHLDDAGYARTNIWEGGKKSAAPRMHRIILPGIETSLHIDHINGNRLDNRKENLRVATCSQNVMNRGKQANNTRGYKGVIYDKSRGKWRAEITANKKSHYLGRFDTAEEAALAYNEAAKELHGEFAYFNEL